MYYNSTRNSGCKVTSAEAIAQGISKEGGLFVPETLPKFTLDDISSMVSLSYNEKAKKVLSKFLTDFTKEELDYCVDNAYTDKKFDSENISEIAKVVLFISENIINRHIPINRITITGTIFSIVLESLCIPPLMLIHAIKQITRPTTSGGTFTHPVITVAMEFA